MKMMSEKQRELIIKLSNEKYLEKGQIFEVEARTGMNLSSENFDNLNSYEASILIKLLIDAPKKEWVEAKMKRQEESMNKYEALVNWAKAQGLKVRNKMKKVTIMKIVREAGMVVPVELV